MARGTDPEVVLALLTGVADEHPSIPKDPRPEALCLGFGDVTLDFELRAWVPRSDRLPAFRSELVVGIERALMEAGVVVPTVLREVRVQAGDAPSAPPRSTVTPGRRRDR